MTVELAHYALILALFLAGIRGYVGLRPGPGTQPVIQALVGSDFFLTTLSFLGLMVAFALSDFSALDVIINSHTAKPLIYKITALWSHHEGSLLLWVWLLSSLTFAFSRVALPWDVQGRALGFLGLLQVGFVFFILVTSNPFLRTFEAPLEGLGLNPLLQDPGLAFHPPILYLGYVGVAVPFALVLSLLVAYEPRRPLDAWLRPWVLISWGALTLGITMGSWWAYYVLGWGGWWFWDPVENVALMPWLALTALLHALRAHAQDGALERWIYLLVIIAFLLSLVGTFLVRSGVLTSVHSFASAPSRGLGILGLFAVYGGLGLNLFARAPLVSPPSVVPLSRTGLLAAHNIFLMLALSIVFFGTLYPLLVQTFGGGSLTVGAPYFNVTLIPLSLPLVFLMALGGRLSPGNRDVAPLAWSLAWAGLVSFGLVALFFYKNKGGPVLALVGLGAGSVGFLAIAQDLMGGIRQPKPLPWWGMHTAHLGFCVLILGMALQVLLGHERDLVLGPNITAQAGPYTLKLQGERDVLADNYYAQEVRIDLSDGSHTWTLAPQKRTYIAPQMTLSQTAMHSNGGQILYLALGDRLAEPGQWIVRFYHHPFVPFVWYGGFLMALSALLGLIHWIRRRPCA